MKRLFILFATLFLSLGARSETVVLQIGDILLQPLNCFVCNLIEAEENTIYSHMGLVLSVEPVLVAEAFGNVTLSNLATFTNKSQKGTRIKVLRFRNSKISGALFKDHGTNMDIFRNDFYKKDYDGHFLWNNLNENMEEKYYCSELISKLLRAFVGIDTPTKKMHFDKYRDKWEFYFKGNVPDGEIGNSPADFDRSELFYSPGEL